MRILVSTRRGAGHFGPLVPFAKALLRDNHEILVAAPRSAAPVIAAAGVPAVCVGITLRSSAHLFRPAIAPALDDLRADFGLAPDPELERFRDTPFFTLTPPSLEHPDVPGPDDALRFREAEVEARPLPAWWSDDRRPLVYLTFGSVAPTMDHFPGVYRDAIDALSLLPVRVLVTVGRDRDPAALGPLPPHVHAARWVPQADVMPHAAAMVCHGGFGTVRAGLAAGVPMAVLPLFADQPYNARRVAELGAGIEVENGTDGLADAVRRLLAEPSYRQAAQRVAAETRQLPTVDAATEILRRLAQAA